MRAQASIADRQLRNQRHIERDAIAFLNARPFSGHSRSDRLLCAVVDRSACALAGLAFPNQSSLVTSPIGQMTIKTIVRDVCFAADEPLRVRSFPIQNRVPLLEPIEFTFSHARPELSGSAAASARSASNSSIDLICALAENSAGGGKTRSSCWSDSMFVVDDDMVAAYITTATIETQTRLLRAPLLACHRHRGKPSAFRSISLIPTEATPQSFEAKPQNSSSTLPVSQSLPQGAAPETQRRFAAIRRC